MDNFHRQKTAVAFLIFNRPDPTQRVFDAIRQAKPSTLFIIADGPRLGRPDDVEKCKAARAIVEQVDWDCKVLTNYSDVNMGCKKRVASGLDWVFNIVEEAIILEDDCIPHPTFFRFCEEMLDRYRHDNRVMAISGNNFQFGKKRTEYSYYFSCYNHIWGWATWRRAWQYFDLSIKLWPEIQHNDLLRSIFKEPTTVKYWTQIFQSAYENKFNSWGYPWTFACWSQNGLAILPNVNLVSNIGFGSAATNTLGQDHQVANLPVQEMAFPLKHPPFMIRDNEADRFTTSILFDSSLSWRIKNKIGRTLRSIKSKLNHTSPR